MTNLNVRQRASRAEVLAAIDSEEQYQLAKWGEQGRNHEIASWILYMQSYLNEAQEIASRTSPETKVLDIIRKVTTMGLVCMQEWGAPKRPPYQPDPGLVARAEAANDALGLVGNEILPVKPEETQPNYMYGRSLYPNYHGEW